MTIPHGSHPSQEQLALFIDCALDDATANWIDRHITIENCDKCKRILSRLDRQQSAAAFENLMSLNASTSDSFDQLDGSGFPVLAGLIIERELSPGVGAMSRVFLAHETAQLITSADAAPHVSRKVAVKLLDFSRIDKSPNAQRLERRFAAREQALAFQLQHRYILPVYSIGKTGSGRAYVVMRYVAGQTLEEAVFALLEAGMLESARPTLLRMFVNLCEAIAYAHSRGVVHRDLKPLNILVGGPWSDLQKGILNEHYVTDWGTGAIDKKLVTPSLGTEVLDGDQDSSSLDAMVRLASRQYAPPEQQELGLAACDRTSDVFSLGGVLAFLLTGKAVFDLSGSSLAEVRRKYAAAKRADMSNCLAHLGAARVPPELLAIVTRCLSPKCEQRPQDAGQLLTLVRDYLQREAARQEVAKINEVVAPIKRRNRRLLTSLLAGSVIVSASCATIYLGWYRETIQYYAQAIDGIHGPVGIERLTFEDVAQRFSSVRMIRSGWFGLGRRIEYVDCRLNPHPLARFETYLSKDQDHSLGVNYQYDATGRILVEVGDAYEIRYLADSQQADYVRSATAIQSDAVAVATASTVDQDQPRLDPLPSQLSDRTETSELKVESRNALPDPPSSYDLKPKTRSKENSSISRGLAKNSSRTRPGSSTTSRSSSPSTQPQSMNTNNAARSGTTRSMGRTSDNKVGNASSYLGKSGAPATSPTSLTRAPTANLSGSSQPLTVPQLHDTFKIFDSRDAKDTSSYSFTTREDGLITKVRWIDRASGKFVCAADGTYGFEFDLRKDGLRLAQHYLGEDGNRTSRKDGVATIRIDWELNTLQLRQVTYCNSEGRPTENEDGIAIVVTTFDSHLRPAETTFYKADNSWAVHRTEGYTKIIYRYDPNGLLTSIEFQAMSSDSSYLNTIHRHAWQYDSSGKLPSEILRPQNVSSFSP